MALHRDLAYLPDSHPRHRLDWYVPEGSTPNCPLWLFLPGGAWITGDKQLLGPQGRAFADRGVSFVVANYRLAPEASHAERLADVKAALAFIRQRAGGQGWSGKLFVGGHSAGAQLAAALGAEPEADPVEGWVGIAGIYDVQSLRNSHPETAALFLHQAFGSEPSEWRRASPRWQAPRGRRWWLAHGRQDAMAPVHQSEGFAKHLLQAGVSVESHFPKSGDHFSVLRDLGTDRNPLTAPLLRFLEAQ